MSTVIDSLERQQLRRVPSFQAGDRVRVHFQVVEGTRRRTQVFEGVVIAQGAARPVERLDRRLVADRKLPMLKGSQRPGPVRADLEQPGLKAL